MWPARKSRPTGLIFRIQRVKKLTRTIFFKSLILELEQKEDLVADPGHKKAH